MRVQKKSHKKAIIITIISLILVASIGIGAYALFSPSNNPSRESTSTPSSSQGNSKPNNNSVNKPSSDQTTATPEHEAEKNIQPGYEGDNVNSNNGLTGVINYSGVSDGKLIIRTTINQALSSGTCRLTLASGSKSVTRDSGIVPNPSSASCEGFDIPTSELGNGAWSIVITVSDGSRSGELKGSVTL